MSLTFSSISVFIQAITARLFNFWETGHSTSESYFLILCKVGIMTSGVCCVTTIVFLKLTRVYIFFFFFFFRFQVSRSARMKLIQAGLVSRLCVGSRLAPHVYNPSEMSFLGQLHLLELAEAYFCKHISSLWFSHVYQHPTDQIKL